MIKRILTNLYKKPLLAWAISGFCIAFTIFNRFANTYFWNRSVKVQVLLLIVLSLFLTITLYLFFEHIIPRVYIRSINRRFVLMTVIFGLIWVMLPFLKDLYKGEFQTPEHLYPLTHQLQIITAGKGNALSRGNRVGVKNIELRDTMGGVLNINFNNKSGPWREQNQEMVPSSDEHAQMSYDFIAVKENSRLNILFSVSPDSGKVIINLDGKERSLDLYDKDEGETLLTINVPSNSMSHGYLILLRLLEAISIATIFRLGEKKLLSITLLTLFSLFILITVARIHPERYGDGYGYLLMTIAFQNHASPNPLVLDTTSMAAILSENRLHVPSYLYPSFYNSVLGLKFSDHFWVYSLVVTPVKIILENLGGNGLVSYQLTNTILFLASLWCFFLLSNLEQNRKLLLTAFLAINPVLLYLTWWHTEVFTFSFVVLSLTFASRKNNKAAALFAAIASMQNQPLVFLAGYYVFLDISQYWPKISIIKLIRSALPAVPSLIPGTFYYVLYGTPNLIMKYSTSMGLITFHKFLSFFLDLNIGIFPYMPVLLLFMIILLIWNVYSRNIVELLFAGIILIIVLATTQIDNWNSDSAGLIRYAVWVVPLLAYYVVCGFTWNRFWKGFWIGGIVYQLFIMMYFGGIEGKINFVEMTPYAKVVLDHFPGLYSPENDIFMERTNHYEGYSAFSFYLSSDGKMKKVLTDSKHFNKFRTLENKYYKLADSGSLDEAEVFLSNQKGLHYLNFPGDEIQVTDETGLREAMAD